VDVERDKVTMSGLEAIGAAASLIGIADAGLRLAKTIHAYVESVSSAEKRLGSLGTNVRTTAIVVREVGLLFENRDSARYVSKDAVETARDVANECQDVFLELLQIMDKTKRRKWTFPFKEQKVELLEAQLEKSKSTLHMMLSLLTHVKTLKRQ
jgi:hypothetical protein